MPDQQSAQRQYKCSYLNQPSNFNTHLDVPLQTSAYLHLLIPTNHSRMFIPFLFQLQPLVAHMNQGTIVSMMDHWVRSGRLPRATPPRHAGVVRDASTCARCPGHQRWRNGHLQENEITKWAALSFLELVDWKKKCLFFSERSWMRYDNGNLLYIMYDICTRIVL